MANAGGRNEMSEYVARVIWRRRQDERYIDNKYGRGHEWVFDGGLTVPASSSPHIVPLPYSDERNVDPEEAFVASLSSCHMLFFLSVAARAAFVVDRYVDDALGIMEKDVDGRLAMTRVTLRPNVTFSGERRPSLDELRAMHHKAHERCFIANSVKTEVVTEIVPFDE